MGPRVEVMGHQSHIGFVATEEAYGQAVLFRIDQPTIPGGEETLKHAEWIGDVFAGAGSVVQRQPIEAVSVLVGSGSILSNHPVRRGDGHVRDSIITAAPSVSGVAGSRQYAGCTRTD